MNSQLLTFDLRVALYGFCGRNFDCPSIHLPCAIPAKARLVLFFGEDIDIKFL